MSFIQNIFSSRDNNSNPATYVGQLGRLWFDPVRNAFFSSDGTTPGGQLVSLDGAGTVGGNTTQVQFNNAGYFAGSANMTYTDQTGLVVHKATIGNINIQSGDISSIVANNSININTLANGNIRFNTHDFHIHTTTNPDPVFNVSSEGDVRIFSPTFNPNIGALSVVISSDGSSLAPQLTGVVIHTTGQDATPSRIYNDADDSYAAYIGRRYNGNAAFPTQVLSNNIISRIGATPYTSNGWPAISTSRIDFKSTENQTETNQGTGIEFWGTSTGSNVISRMLWVADNALTFYDGTTQTTAAIPMSYLGNALGVATLDSSGKVPFDQIAPGAMVYKGTWDASTNTPFLVDGTGTTGWIYAVDVGGTANTGSGPVVYAPGDWIAYNGTAWHRITGSSAVVSFNTRTGAITLSSTDVSNALGYTPYNGATNPNGYVNASLAAAAAPVQSVFGRAGNVVLASSDVTTALTSGSLTNEKLANSNVIVGNTTLTLGSTVSALTGLTAIATTTVTTTDLTTSGISNLGAVGNVRISGGSAGQFLSTNGTGNLSYRHKYYGSFLSTATQTNPSITAATPVYLNTTVLSNGVTVVANSRMTVSQAGTYDLQFSLQVSKSDAGTDSIEIWLGKNGLPINNTNTIVEMYSAGRTVVAWNFIEAANAGDYFELYWYSADIAMQLLSDPATTNPIRPAAPSAIITVFEI